VNKNLETTFTKWVVPGRSDHVTRHTGLWFWVLTCEIKEMVLP